VSCRCDWLGVIDRYDKNSAGLLRKPVGGPAPHARHLVLTLLLVKVITGHVPEQHEHEFRQAR
jgi:hypothetical protein